MQEGSPGRLLLSPLHPNNKHNSNSHLRELRAQLRPPTTQLDFHLAFAGRMQLLADTFNKRRKKVQKRAGTLLPNHLPALALASGCGRILTSQVAAELKLHLDWLRTCLVCAIAWTSIRTAIVMYGATPLSRLPRRRKKPAIPAHIDRITNRSRTYGLNFHLASPGSKSSKPYSDITFRHQACKRES